MVLQQQLVVQLVDCLAPSQVVRATNDTDYIINIISFLIQYYKNKEAVECQSMNMKEKSFSEDIEA